MPKYLKVENQSTTPENLRLIEGATAGNVIIVSDALKAGAKVDFFYDPEERKNALHIAAEQGNDKVTTILLDAGAVVDAVAATTQSTALNFAASSSANTTAGILLKAGADVNHANAYGNTALHQFAKNANLAGVQLALSAGAYAKVSNNKGSSPIHFLCLEDNNTGRGVKEDGKSQLAILRELVDAGVDVDFPDGRGLTPVHCCCVSGNLTLLQALVEQYSAHSNTLDGKGLSPAQTAEFHRRESVIKYLSSRK